MLNTVYWESSTEEQVSQITFFTIRSLWENFCDSGNLIYKNSNWDQKVQENICECFQIHEIHEVFLPWTIPNMRYMAQEPYRTACGIDYFVK